MPALARSDLEVIEVTGDDRITYLGDVTTQRLDDMAPGEVRGALVLDPHGAPRAMFWVVAHAERLALLAPPAAAEHVMDVLATRTFLSDASFERVPGDVWSLRGEGVATALADAGAAGLDVGRWRPVDGSLVVRHAFGAELVGDGLVGVLSDLEAVEVGGQVDLERAALAAGEPRFGREVVAPHLPEEMGLLPTHVHLDKGCYPGQEAVARMWMLGRPRRRLARVRVERGVATGWSHGTGRERVEVTACLDGVGLAWVPPSAAVGARFGDATGAVEVQGFVDRDVMPPGHDPDVPRRRDRR